MFPGSRLTEDAGVELPIICGAMYPCSNPELIAAVSEAGGLGIVQPISLSYVHGHKMRDGLRYIRGLTGKPFGFNAIVEATSKVYLERMEAWVDIALEEGVRFFVTALGKPDRLVRKIHAVGGKVYHDVTLRNWAERAVDGGVDGLICVNRRAGGHAGTLSDDTLVDQLRTLNVPLVSAGGYSRPEDVRRALDLGYDGVQLGTRFIATEECSAHDDYKAAICRASESDIVLTDKISGVPVSIINTPHIQEIGTQANPLMQRLLRHPKGKHYARLFYSLKSIWQLKRASVKGQSYRDVWQAGKSVAGIDRVEPVAQIMERYREALNATETRAESA